MVHYLRLRQVCLVVRELEPIVEDIKSILDLEVCYRDPAVGKYGLVNALLPIGTSFLEVVAPVVEDTAARRFLARSGGHGGYMAIFDCSDPEERRRHAERMGIRIANIIRYDDYAGIQLHPRDCRAAMIEFNHTRGGSALTGPYHPAGAEWQAAVHVEQTQALVAMELEAPDPEDLAEHWSRILQLPLSMSADGPRIELGHGAVHFVGAAGRRECLGGLCLAVADVTRARAAATERGYQVDGNSFRLGGVHLRLQAAAGLSIGRP